MASFITLQVKKLAKTGYQQLLSFKNPAKINWQQKLGVFESHPIFKCQILKNWQKLKDANRV